MPKIYHPFIIGPNGENLNKLQSDTNARINIPPQSVMNDDIVITGEIEGVQLAKARIEAIHKEMEKSVNE